MARLALGPTRDVVIIDAVLDQAAQLPCFVNPVILGAGKSLFQTADDRIRLILTRTRTFGSGNVLLYYQPATRSAALGKGRTSCAPD